MAFPVSRVYGPAVPAPSGAVAASWQQWYAHMSAALSERLCPYCAALLPDAMVCRGTGKPAHRPVRFHLCAERAAEVYLDVPDYGARPREFTCEACGQVE